LTYLLDTNVVCEPTCPAPNGRVLTWLAARNPLELHVSVVTLAEIDEGVARLPPSHKQDRLRAWRGALVAATGDRLIAVGAGISAAWGALRARLAAARQTISPLDGFIAATAECRGLVLVTRNEKHFRAWGGALINPWMAP
jgi:predicted nucleic acid-binding protein